MKIIAVDLFCGVGGLSHGVKNSGIDVVAGIDINNNCKYAYEENNKAIFINKSIEELSNEEVNNLYPKDSIKVLMGCAPCQPFSTYSFRYTKDGHKDDKWRLLYYFLNIIEGVKPHIISMENVPKLSKEIVFNDFVNRLQEIGYNVSWNVVNCASYGVPQNRKRLVLLASSMSDISMIEPIYDEKSYITVKEAIGFLPKIKDGETYQSDNLHRSSKLSELNKTRIKQSIPGGTWRDWDENLKLSCHKKSTGNGYRSVYGRMEWDKPSPTITTQFYGYGNGRFGHPEQDRAISIREGALLQSFPKEYKFVDENNYQSNRELGVQIGNAVPVKLGEAIGKSILKHIEYNKNYKE